MQAEADFELLRAWPASPASPASEPDQNTQNWRTPGALHLKVAQRTTTHKLGYHPCLNHVWPNIHNLVDVGRGAKTQYLAVKWGFPTHSLLIPFSFPFVYSASVDLSKETVGFWEKGLFFLVLQLAAQKSHAASTQYLLLNPSHRQACAIEAHVRHRGPPRSRRVPSQAFCHQTLGLLSPPGENLCSSPSPRCHLPEITSQPDKATVKNGAL